MTSGNQGRRTGLKANSSSLLVGILQDAEGNRFTPSHTSKNGRRYRYYVCQTGEGGRAATKPIRLPAHDVERQVTLRLQSFLQAGKEVMDELIMEEDSPVRIHQIIAAATEQFGRLRSASSVVARDFVRKVVSRVVVYPDRIDVEVSKQDLRAALISDPHLLSPQAELRQWRNVHDDLICLAIAGRVKRCGEEIRLVLRQNPLGQIASHPASSLLKALARAWTWQAWILDGKVSGRRSIGHKLGVDERYVGKVLKCAFLAPDIVEAILDGRQPPELSFARLTRGGLPSSWVEQRKELVFPERTPG